MLCRILLALACVLFAISLRAADLGYLADMPPAERILKEVQGKDAYDRAARQAAAFRWMKRAIGTLAGPREFSLSPEEKALIRTYMDALGPVEGSVDQKARQSGWYGVMYDYEADAGFQNELVTRLFTPRLQAQYRAAKQASDQKSQAIRTNGQAVASGAGNMAATAGGASGKPDPAIAKAKAAGVDTTVFGVPLGEPLSLPYCANLKQKKRHFSDDIDVGAALQGASTETTCQFEFCLGDGIAFVFGAKRNPAARCIHLAKNACPNWAFCQVNAMLGEGRLGVVSITLQKGASPDYVAKQLRAKYGNPARRETMRYQNDYGAQLKLDDLEWLLPGLHVKFSPNPEGGGVVVVETETGRMHRERASESAEASQPKL